MVKIADRIIVDPQVCFGKPVIEGTRIPVHMVLELLEEGLTPREIKEKCYSDLTEKDILACIAPEAELARLVETGRLCLNLRRALLTSSYVWYTFWDATLGGER